MPLESRDLAYLLDMVTCCDDIIAFTSEVTFEVFENDRMRRLATERQLETLGEAANHISTGGRQVFPEVDWPKIVGLRNKLAHDYGEILAARVWQIAKKSIVELRSQLLKNEGVRLQIEK